MSRPSSRFAVSLVGVLALAGSTANVPAHAATKTTRKPKARPTTPATTAPATVAPTTAKPVDTGVSTSGISAARCAANKKAGKITYLSGFDYAAAASIVELNVADAKGYFAKMCLDVDVKASFSTANYALVSDNKAQFASSGSYTELLKQTPKDAQLVAVYNLGKTAIDVLMVRDDVIKGIRDLRGKVIGVKGDLPPAITALLLKNGLKRDVDYTTVPVEGFNPIAHFQLPIDALPGWRSNEPGQLERANVATKIFDPLAYGVPGSFGLVYTNAKFLKEHPTAAEDFVRAALKGFADAAANPDEAIDIAVKRINGNGNRNFLSPVGEAFRWKTEVKLIAATQPKGTAAGQIIPSLLQNQVDEYAAAGVFTSKPSIAGTYDDSLVRNVVDSTNTVVWPK